MDEAVTCQRGERHYGARLDERHSWVHHNVIGNGLVAGPVPCGWYPTAIRGGLSNVVPNDRSGVTGQGTYEPGLVADEMGVIISTISCGKLVARGEGAVGTPTKYPWRTVARSWIDFGTKLA